MSDIDNKPQDEGNQFDFSSWVKSNEGRDTLEAYLSTSAGRGLIRSQLDSERDKAVNHFKEKELPSLLESEVSKRLESAKAAEEGKNPETEALRRELEEIKRQNLIEKQKSLALKKASEKGLPTDLAERFIGSSDEETLEQLNGLETMLSGWRDKIKEEIRTELSRTSSPTTANTSDLPVLQKQLSEAQAQGKTADAIAIQRQINSLQTR